MAEYDYYELHTDSRLGYVVKGYGSYPRSSVNHGMTRIVFLDSFDTEAEAIEAYPQLQGENYGSALLDQDLTRQPDTAPDWFDPADAGERWDDDY